MYLYQVSNNRKKIYGISQQLLYEQYLLANP